MISLESLWGAALTEDRLSHAYLLVGEGIQEAARRFLLRLYCADGGCRECVDCLRILHGAHPDVRWLRREGTRISIDQIRQLQKDARYRPLEAGRKVYVLDGAEDLSHEGANSLLRILESPPGYVMLLLLARGLHRLLPTIVSRCQILRLKPPSLDQVRAALAERGFSPKEAEYLAALAHGWPERLFRVISGEDEVKRPLERRAEVRARLRELGAPDIAKSLEQSQGMIETHEESLEVLRRLSTQQPHDVLETARALGALSPEALRSFVHEALRWHRDLALVKAPGGEALIFHRDRRDELWERRALFDERQLERIVDDLEDAERVVRGNANVQLLLESLLFKMAGSR